jgi:hypothetical protein
MTVEDIMALGCQGSALRIRDRRGDDVILGYGSDQVPGRAVLSLGFKP